MICNNCKRVKDIPSCVDNIIIGSISTIDQTVYVFFQDQRTVVNRLEAISDGTGIIDIDMTAAPNDDFKIMPDMIYDLWVTKDDAPSFTDKEELTISGDVNTHLCVSFLAEKVRNDSSVITITSETLVVV